MADAARAILDGHIVLSRRLAEQGHYPAIDIEASISRVMPQVIGAQQLQQAQRFKQIYARYQENRDLISVGAYASGSDAETDLAIERMPFMNRFLQQPLTQAVELETSFAELSRVTKPSPAATDRHQTHPVARTGGVITT